MPGTQKQQEPSEGLYRVQCDRSVPLKRPSGSKIGCEGGIRRDVLRMAPRPAKRGLQAAARADGGAVLRGVRGGPPSPQVALLLVWEQTVNRVSPQIRSSSRCFFFFSHKYPLPSLSNQNIIWVSAWISASRIAIFFLTSKKACYLLLWPLIFMLTLD